MEPPINMTASWGTSTTGVILDWDPSSEDWSAFKIYRSTQPQASTAEDVAGRERYSSQYADSTAIPGKVYYYWVKTVYSGNESGFGTIISGMRQVKNPTSLTISVDDYADKVTIQWVDTGAFRYHIHRAVTPIFSESKQVADLWTANSLDAEQLEGQSLGGINYGSTQLWEDRYVIPGRNYYYWVTSHKIDSNEEYDAPTFL